MKEDGIAIDNDTHQLLKEVVEGREKIFHLTNKHHSTCCGNNKRQSCLKNKSAMQWHPLIIRWCLSIYLKSPSTYKHIHTSPFLFLPCKNTLLKCNNFTDPGCGFNIDIIENLVSSLKIDYMKDYEKYVCLVFDEMKIKRGLVFCKTTGKLVGFTEMGEINNEL